MFGRNIGYAVFCFYACRALKSGFFLEKIFDKSRIPPFKKGRNGVIFKRGETLAENSYGGEGAISTDSVAILQYIVLKFPVLPPLEYVPRLQKLRENRNFKVRQV